MVSTFEHKVLVKDSASKRKAFIFYSFYFACKYDNLVIQINMFDYMTKKELKQLMQNAV